MTTQKPTTLAQKPVIGLMSGTSLDGIDAVLCAVDQPGMPLLHSAHLDLPAGLRQELLALNQAGPDELRRAALASQQLARCYAELVAMLLDNSGHAAADVAAIGCHGQTVRHQPADGYTLQLVDGALLAELTGITTVTNFRARDVAAGGQGAPLVPAFHAAAFQHAALGRAVVNIGGFSNITLLVPGHPTRGHDCGPGNALLDSWILLHQRERYDRDGVWARSGQLLPGLLAELLAHPFFLRAPPRSTGREDFNLDWLTSRSQVPGARPEDVQRTLLELSARAIAADVRAARPPVNEVYLCGGGAANRFLVERLRELLAPLPVLGTRALGMDEQDVEAQAFAWLAAQCLRGLPGNLPEVTGARGPRVLGAIYPA